MIRRLTNMDLENARMIDITLTLPSEYDAQVEYLYDCLPLNNKHRLKQRKIDALKFILANLDLSYSLGKPIKYSRRSNTYSIGTHYGKDFYTYRIVVPLINALLRQGLAEGKRGWTAPETAKRYISRLWTNAQMLHVIPHFGDLRLEYVPIDRIIQLRDKDKKSVPYPETAETIRMREVLSNYNNMIERAEVTLLIPGDHYLTEKEKETINSLTILNNKLLTNINNYYNFINYSINIYNYYNNTINISPLLITFDNIEIPYCITICRNNLHRVFNDNSFFLGGRFYGADYQRCSERLRSFIQINNSPTVELDYSGMHLRILYHLEGIDFRNDLYSFTCEGDTHLRSVLKSICLYALNCSNRKTAEKACWYNLAIKGNQLPQNPESYQFIRDMMDLMVSKHGRVAHHFFTGIGKLLQNIDSQITGGIMRRFTELDVPVLCIHDSFIVPGGFEEMLFEIMQEEYYKVMGFYPVIK
jgi:hypothetical protein